MVPTPLLAFIEDSCLLMCQVIVVLCQEKQEENELRALPPASAAQLKAVDAAVLETARQQGISEEDLAVRKAVVSRMKEIVKQHLSGCRFELSIYSQRALSNMCIERLTEVRYQSHVCLLISVRFYILVFPACSLRLYGSCLTRFAFKTSDINIDVIHPSSVSLHKILDGVDRHRVFQSVVNCK